MYIYGKNVAKQTLESGKKIVKAFLSEKISDRQIIDLLRQNKVKINYCKNFELD